MTTIAYRAGVLAADTLVAYDTFTNGERNKIADCGDYHVAMAGPAFLRETFEKWVKAGCSVTALPALLEQHNDQFSAILVAPWGAPFEYNRGHLVPIDADYYAIGSGAAFAMGAMAMGADALHAVGAASAHDKATGATITAYTAPLYSR